MSARKSFPWSGALLLALVLPAGAGAEEALLYGNPVHFCRNGAFPGGGDYPGAPPTFKLGALIGPSPSPIPFLHDDDGSGIAGRCPRADNPKCLQNAAVRRGDRVLLSKTFNGFACAWHQRRYGREQVDWLPLNRLAIQDPDPNPPLERWLGLWRAAGEPLTLRPGPTPGTIQVDGQAFWPGPNLPNTHFGQLQGSARPVQNTLHIEDFTEPEGVRCKARLTLVGDWLVVSDNHHCGGLNVTFDGVYQRQQR